MKRQSGSLFPLSIFIYLYVMMGIITECINITVHLMARITRELWLREWYLIIIMLETMLDGESCTMVRVKNETSM